MHAHAQRERVCMKKRERLIVRLDEDYIVFRGGEDEAASAHLTGRLLLCLSEPLNIKHLRLHLTGISRVW